MGAIHFSLDEKLMDFFIRELSPAVFVETGTFKGDTLAQARGRFERCHSVELSPELHQAAARRFAGDPGVSVHCGHSGEVLAGLAPSLAGGAVFYWLDAHWCVADHTAGEDSQSPLLDELRAIAPLHADSVVLIDDARLYLSTPPKPHRVADWPDIHDIFEVLAEMSPGHRLMVFDDVIAIYPGRIRAALGAHVHEHAEDWLKVAGESRRHRARRTKGLRGLFRR
jgi:hypothetical protein